MGAIIDIADGDDWFGLYVNDKLMCEGHSLDVAEVLQILQDEVVEFRGKFNVDLGWLTSEGHLPERLEDVKID